jgi:hypothetical protein
MVKNKRYPRRLKQDRPYEAIEISPLRYALRLKCSLSDFDFLTIASDATISRRRGGVRRLFEYSDDSVYIHDSIELLDNKFIICDLDGFLA